MKHAKHGLNWFIPREPGGYDKPTVLKSEKPEVKRDMVGWAQCESVGDGTRPRVREPLKMSCLDSNDRAVGYRP